MKKQLCVAMSLVLVFAFVGCIPKNRTPELSSGYYYATGEYEEGLTPVITIVSEKKEISICEGHFYSYAENGIYKIKSGNLIAETENTKFTFEIKDENTLVLTQFTDKVWDWLQVGMEFVYSDDMK